MPAAELDNTGRDLIARLTAINADIDTLTAYADALKDQLRDYYGPGAYTIDGRKALSIRPNRRFDPNRATQVLPPELVALCTVPKLDSATARKNLPPALFDQCMSEAGKPVVTLA